MIKISHHFQAAGLDQKHINSWKTLFFHVVCYPTSAAYTSTPSADSHVHRIPIPKLEISQCLDKHIGRLYRLSLWLDEIHQMSP